MNDIFDKIETDVNDEHHENTQSAISKVVEFCKEIFRKVRETFEKLYQILKDNGFFDGKKGISYRPSTSISNKRCYTGYDYNHSKAQTMHRVAESKFFNKKRAKNHIYVKKNM